MRFFLIPVFFWFNALFSETVDLSVTVSAGTNLEFENFSLHSSDFILQEDGSHLFFAESPWYLASNSPSGSFKLQGRLTQPLGNGWALEMILDPPEDKNGVFGVNPASSKYLGLTTENQTFLYSIQKGRIGDLQKQKIRLFATHKGFIEKMNSPFQIVIQWTLMDE